MARLASTSRPGPSCSGEVVADAVAGEFDASELWPRVASAVAALPAGERDVLMLYVWEELSYEEIASALSLPVGTVRSRLNRARNRLRTLRPPGPPGPRARPGREVAVAGCEA